MFIPHIFPFLKCPDSLLQECIATRRDVLNPLRNLISIITGCDAVVASGTLLLLSGPDAKNFGQNSLAMGFLKRGCYP